MDETAIRRVRFRAWRRGFREADLIFGPFADSHARTMSPGALERFETLLEQPDHDLYGWVMGSQPVPPAFDDDVMAAVRAFVHRPLPGAT